MAPKAKRGKSLDKSGSRGHQVSTSSSSQLAEDSISAPNSLSEPSGSLTATAPELSMSTFSAASAEDSIESKEPASPKMKGKRGKGRRKKGGRTSDEEEEEVKIDYATHYRGPPPDEEFLNEVLEQVGTKDRWKEAYWLEALHLKLREGEVGIGQEVNTRNLHGFTPLAVAAASGDARVTALLLEHRADVSMASTGRAELPLHHAANFSHPVVTQLLVGPCQKLGIIDARSCTGWTPLHTCANSGDRQVFKILMSAKADLETRNPLTGNEHALHIAARASNLDIIEILLAADAEVNCKDSLSRTPLHLAAAMSHADCVGLLLRSRADPHHRGGPGGQTPLECVPAEPRPRGTDFNSTAQVLGKAEKEAMVAQEQKDIAERETVVRLLTSYQRPPPSPPRVDIRFDQRDTKALI